MAIRWAIASGNWSSTAIWNGGTLPQPDDDVFADGREVFVDQTVTVLSLNTTQRSGGTLGGNFRVLIDGVVVNCTTINAGNTVLRLTATPAFTLTVNCTTINGSNTNTFVAAVDNQSANGTVIVNAVTVNGGAQNTATGVRNNSTGTVILNVTSAIGGSAAIAAAAQNVSTGTFILNGNAIGGSISTAVGFLNSATGTATLNGIAIASDFCEAINNASTGTFTIAAARHAANGRAPWTGNGRIFFSNLDLAHVTVNSSANVQRMLGRRLLAPFGSFEGGLHG